MRSACVYVRRSSKRVCSQQRDGFKTSTTTRKAAARAEPSPRVTVLCDEQGSSQIISRSKPAVARSTPQVVVVTKPSIPARKGPQITVLCDTKTNAANYKSTAARAATPKPPSAPARASVVLTGEAPSVAVLDKQRRSLCDYDSDSLRQLSRVELQTLVKEYSLGRANAKTEVLLRSVLEEAMARKKRIQSVSSSTFATTAGGGPQITVLCDAKTNAANYKSTAARATTAKPSSAPARASVVLTGEAPSVTVLDEQSPSVGGPQITVLCDTKTNAANYKSTAARATTAKPSSAPARASVVLTGEAPSVTVLDEQSPSVGGPQITVLCDAKTNAANYKSTAARATTAKPSSAPARASVVLTGEAPSVTVLDEQSPSVGGPQITVLCDAKTNAANYKSTAARAATAKPSSAPARASVVLTGEAPSVTVLDEQSPSVGGPQITVLCDAKTNAANYKSTAARAATAKPSSAPARASVVLSDKAPSVTVLDDPSRPKVTVLCDASGDVAHYHAAAAAPRVMVLEEGFSGAHAHDYEFAPAMLTPASMVFDFQSDTTTRPTAAMLDVMRDAPVGDDVMGEDPSVAALEQRVADMFGKEAALFAASGTMSNQLALRALGLGALDNVLCDARAHIHVWENGGVHAHCGAATKCVAPMAAAEACEYSERVQKGTASGGGSVEVGLGVGVETDGRLLSAADLAAHIDTEHHMYHACTTRVVSLENTLHGQVHPFEQVKQMSDYVHGINRQQESRAIATNTQFKKISLHLDGARLWNAMVAEPQHTPQEHGRLFDSISLCMSKGMGAPIGSLAVGDNALIDTAKHFRKMYGGAWRQAGGLAAACNYTIDHHWQRMTQDHENAQLLEQGLERLGWEIKVPVHTNMVWATPPPDMDLQGAKVGLLENHGIRVNDVYPGGTTRFVVHCQTPRHAVEKLLDALAEEGKRS